MALPKTLNSLFMLKSPPLWKSSSNSVKESGPEFLHSNVDGAYWGGGLCCSENFLGKIMVCVISIMWCLIVWFARYMEQSHQLLEQRNDSLKSSSEHNQARLLQAEQDKVRVDAPPRIIGANIPDICGSRWCFQTA